MSLVTTDDFLNELHKEMKAMKSKGTSYRYMTAVLSLQVANTQSDITPFRNRQQAYKVAKRVLTGADHERLLDVAQMLQTVLCTLERDLNMSNEEKKEFEKRMQTVKKVEWVLV